MAAITSMAVPQRIRDDNEGVSSFTPVSSPPLTPRSDGHGSPPPPPRSPPLGLGYGAPGSPPLHVQGSPRLGCGTWVSTPQSQEGANCTVGSVAALQWSGEQSVEWLRFAPREVTDEWLQNAALIEEESGERLSGEFHLMPGEYITAVRGRSEEHASRAAEWMILVTSELRSVTVGCERHSEIQVPSFSWMADEGKEIYDISLDSNGCICDVLQRAL